MDEANVQDRLLFVVSPPRAGSTLLQRMLGSHSQVYTHPEPHLITPLAHLGYYDNVDKAPFDHINAAEAMRAFVSRLPHGEDDYLDALRAYTDTLYGRMLAPSGRRLFLDKTPAYALVLPFLTKLYPRAKYVVLTRHPLAVMSSYANSFFYGDWHEAARFNPILDRYVPAMANLLRRTDVAVQQVGYESLVSSPADELSRLFSFLGLENEPGAVNYGENFDAQEGMGDPINVHKHNRPVTTSTEKWVDELLADDTKRKLAEEQIARLDPADLASWGYPADHVFDSLQQADGTPRPNRSALPKMNNYVLQRRVLIALKKDINNRPLGRLLRRVRYYCDVLLRE